MTYWLWCFLANIILITLIPEYKWVEVEISQTNWAYSRADYIKMLMGILWCQPGLKIHVGERSVKSISKNAFQKSVFMNVFSLSVFMNTFHQSGLMNTFHQSVLMNTFHQSVFTNKFNGLFYIGLLHFLKWYCFVNERFINGQS